MALADLLLGRRVGRVLDGVIEDVARHDSGRQRVVVPQAHDGRVPQLAQLAQRASRWQGVQASAAPTSECAVASVSPMTGLTLLRVGLVVARNSGMSPSRETSWRSDCARGKEWRGEGAYVSGFARTSSSALQRKRERIAVVQLQVLDSTVDSARRANRCSLASLRHTAVAMRHDAG